MFASFDQWWVYILYSLLIPDILRASCFFFLLKVHLSQKIGPYNVLTSYDKFRRLPSRKYSWVIERCDNLFSLPVCMKTVPGKMGSAVMVPVRVLPTGRVDSQWHSGYMERHEDGSKSDLELQIGGQWLCGDTNWFSPYRNIVQPDRPIASIIFNWREKWHS